MDNNLVDLQQMAQQKRQQEIDIPPDGMSIDLLQAVYRNSSIDLSVRMRAAALAIAYELPKLQMIAQVTEHDFAVLLDRRIENMKRIENGQQTKPQQATNGGTAVEITKPLPRLPDRRYRRL